MIRFVFFTFFISVACFAQYSKMNTTLMKALHTNISKTYPVLVQGNVGVVKDFTSSHNGYFKYSAGNISSVCLTGHAIQQLSKKTQIKRIEYYVNHLRTLDDTSNIKNNVLKVHQGASPLPQAYDGTGVIFGFIDTGIDFRHPDFKDSTGKTRIKWLWVQQPNYTGGAYTGGDIPAPYNYGMEWNNQKIDSGLCGFQDSVAFAHGTRVAGIAAGNGKADSSYKGVATKADIMCVALDFSSYGPVISDGVNYLVNKATLANKPLVINISLGDYYGSHDGQDLQALLIDSLTANIPGRCVVAASGDAGNIPIHLQYTVNADTNFTFTRIPSYNQIDYGVFADTTNFKNVHYTIGVYDSTHYIYHGNIGYRNIISCLGTVINDTIFYDGRRIGIIQTAASVYGKTYELDVNIIADSIGYFWTLETTGSGFFDAWYDPDGNGDLEFVPTSLIPGTLASMPRMTYYKAPDINQNICTSFQCSNNVITVGNYTDRNGFTSVGGLFSPQPGPYDSLSASSSVGPTRDGRIKPDVAATGDNIVAPGAIWACQYSAGCCPTSGAVSQDTLYTVFNGTSASSPNAAGVVALYFQKNPTTTNLQVKQAITGCTTIDQYTGSALPNNSWGYGKLNGYGALLCNQTTGIKSTAVFENVQVFPNPAQQQIQFVFNNDGNNNANLTIYSLLGAQVYQTYTNTNNISIPVQQLADGLYLYKIVRNNTLVSEGKFIKN
jgi:subtilase family protein/type IX secretion system substrate protein